MKKGLTYFSFLLIGFTLGVFSPMLLGRCHRAPDNKQMMGHGKKHIEQGKHNRRANPSSRFVKKLSKHLDLNEEQKTTALKIFKEQHTKLEEIRTKTVPQYRAIKKDTKTAIRAILNDEQKNIFDEKIKNKNFLRKKRGRRHLGRHRKGNHLENTEHYPH